MKKNLKGSQTLEASIVVALLLFLIIFLLYQAFYFYNQAVLREICRQELILLHEQIHTKEDVEKQIKEYLHFVNSVSVNYSVTGDKAVLDVRTEWVGNDIPFFPAKWLTIGSVCASSELENLSGPNQVRRRTLVEFGE